jgi:hypothetical protein
LDFANPTLPDIGVNTARVRRALTRLLACPVNVIMTAHTRTDDNQGIVTIKPGFMPALRVDIERTQTLIGYLTCAVDVNEEGNPAYDRRLQVHPTKKITAKSRIGNLPVVIKNPDLSDILDGWTLRGKPLQEETELVPESEGLMPPDVHNVTTTGLEI